MADPAARTAAGRPGEARPGSVLVTGATGFAGRHLVAQLLEHEPDIAGWGNPAGHGTGDVIIDPRVTWSTVDVADRNAVARAIAECQPSTVYHCAGFADVHRARTDPATALRVNVMGTDAVLRGLATAGLRVPVVVTASALVYRQSTEALTEDSPLGPSGPYGVSKLAQEMVALADDGLVVVARPFNHAGPGQSSAYVTSSFARQIAEAEAGLRPPVLRVGNLDARRDITDVRDTVRAYHLLARKGRPGRAYNVCRGEAYRVGDLLDWLVGYASIRIAIERDPERLRPDDNPVVLGNPARIRAETGWEPRIPIEQTLADLLDYWRHRVASPETA
jgi:GDP-4-dehydro-6-deoxy-D-mannose reductase